MFYTKKHGSICAILCPPRLFSCPPILHDTFISKPTFYIEILIFLTYNLRTSILSAECRAGTANAPIQPTTVSTASTNEGTEAAGTEINSQATEAGTESMEAATASKVETSHTEDDKTIPTEYKSALKKAGTYSETMKMSKAGIYDQLTSEYGEKFSPKAAQYAIDNLAADMNANALAKAKSYQDMNMSPEAIRDQLSSPYGEKFTSEEADYAVSHLN